ncbi:nuclear transport factor 2 family protein [Reichenbachiella sp.]|uniref:nuclear transport factor 2 family protein n=1 Tax=Reichenbachiella sp. TaxID=2184521 RepID=UPI003BAEA3C4
MKLVLYLMLATLAISSCNSTEATQANNVKLIESYVAAVENNEYETMASLLADDYVGIGPSVKDTTSRSLALAAWKTNSSELYESIKYTKSRIFPITVKDGDYPGEWVTNFALLTIKYKNGKSVQLLANTSYKIKEGKITNSFTFYNEADALEQLDYVFIDLNDLNQ